MSSSFNTTPQKRYLEDYVEGAVHEFGPVTITEEEIIQFGKNFDPQLFHTDPESAKEILVVEQPWENHNGSHILFGPDGFLYMGYGFGRVDPDPDGNAQSVDIFLGKLLRIDVDRGDPYSIPEDNPFFEGGGLPEIWAYGLRNPWRFSVSTEHCSRSFGRVSHAEKPCCLVELECADRKVGSDLPSHILDESLAGYSMLIRRKRVRDLESDPTFIRRVRKA